MSAVVLFSGGQDSTTCLLWALDKFEVVKPLAVNYGQRHNVELTCARSICESLGLDLVIAESLPLKLVDDVVTGRNTLLLTLAAIYAADEGLENVIIGACASDKTNFKDCRQEFISSMQDSLRLGIDSNLSIIAPLIDLNKGEVFALADRLGGLDLILKSSHTCYVGDRSKWNVWGYGCGLCASCRVRADGYEVFKCLTQS